MGAGNAGRSGAADDFDSVFGEASPAKRHFSPKKSGDPIKVRALNLQDKLMRPSANLL